MMLSTCPSCLSQVSHAENASQVSCQCGEKFSPFIRAEEWSNEMEDVSIGTPKFAESEAAFQEIRDFGDSLEGTATKPPPPVTFATEAPSIPQEESKSVEKPIIPQTQVGVALSDNILMTTASSFPDYQIQTYFLPISLLAMLPEGSDSPLDSAFQKLWEKTAQTGANALIDLKWKIFSDGTRVLLTAIPVSCTKVS